ncbi:hypothetical protein EVAR_81157_1 [Eumeta japonica]|uniref:Uncharacterized protein n=1 Tax=Eumeta variegata TaxID=151549 RepID=A0A4C1ULE8_EUMVA|nr:hypothetical protein EVAR_81157_1 [Eumeta japonica]
MSGGSPPRCVESSLTQPGGFADTCRGALTSTREVLFEALNAVTDATATYHINGLKRFRSVERSNLLPLGWQAVRLTTEPPPLAGVITQRENKDSAPAAGPRTKFRPPALARRVGGGRMCV